MLNSPLANKLGIVFLAVLVVIGGIAAGAWMRDWLQVFWRRSGGLVFGRQEIPIAKLPGPPRLEAMEFRLDRGNAGAMSGSDDPENERWSDIAGNYYGSFFARNFSYGKPADEGGPEVLVALEPEGPTLRGRLEAQRLKPNFAYQLKLVGDFASDRAGFEVIGGLGRWRLPGLGTNYTDEDYAAYPDKAAVSAYILFDFFITDATGSAVRDFALDSSLHVLWNTRQRSNGVDQEKDVLWVAVDASGDDYMLPKAEAVIEGVWAERERSRYATPGQLTTLPPGSYRARLELTEESFHSRDADGGWWGTVMSLPVGFSIAPGTARSAAATPETEPGHASGRAAAE